jgi:hypothetical protein
VTSSGGPSAGEPDAVAAVGPRGRRAAPSASVAVGPPAWGAAAGPAVAVGSGPAWMSSPRSGSGPSVGMGVTRESGCRSRGRPDDTRRPARETIERPAGHTPCSRPARQPSSSGECGRGLPAVEHGRGGRRIRPVDVGSLDERVSREFGLRVRARPRRRAEVRPDVPPCGGTRGHPRLGVRVRMALRAPAHGPPTAAGRCPPRRHPGNACGNAPSGSGLARPDRDGPPTRRPADIPGRGFGGPSSPWE